MNNAPNSDDPQPPRWDGNDPGWVEPRPEEVFRAPDDGHDGNIEPTDDMATLAPAETRPAEAPRLAWDASPPPPPPPPLFQSPRGERYPMRYEVLYPESLSRPKTLLRVFLIIPALLFSNLVNYVIYAAFVAGWIPVFVKRKYPSWLFAAGGGGLAWTARLQAYGLLLTDAYPSFDYESKSVTLEYDSPPNGRLSRWRVLFWKFALLVPHLIVLGFLWMAVLVVTFIAWWAILATGRYPRGLFGFVTGVQRWQYRVAGYFASYNDRFPPYSLSEASGPGSTAGAVASGIVGFLVVGAFAGVIAAAANLGGRQEIDVDYEALKAGRARDQATFYAGPADRPTFTVSLNKVTDPETVLSRAITVDSDWRVVLFEIGMLNRAGTNELRVQDVRLAVRDSGGERTAAVALLIADGRGAPTDILANTAQPTAVRAYFIIPKAAIALHLDIDPPWFDDSGRRGEGVRFRFP